MNIHIYKILLSLTILTLSLSASYGQKWEVMFDSSQVLMNNGKYPEAIEIMEKVMNIVYEDHLKHPEDTVYGIMLDHLGFYYELDGQYEKAEEFYKQGIETLRDAVGEADPIYGGAINSLALYYYNIGQYDKAEVLYKESSEICKNSVGVKHNDYAETIGNLALLYRDVGRVSEAELLFNEALEIKRNNLPADSLLYAASLSNMALLYYDIGRYSESEQLYLEAREIRRKLLGTDHTDYAQTVNNLAILYHDIKQFEDAERLYKECLSVLERLFGGDHIYYAITLDNLALMYDDMGELLKAEPLYVKSMKIRMEQPRGLHPDDATSYHNLAGLYQKMGRYAESEILFNEAVKIFEEFEIRNQPKYYETLYYLANLYEEMGNYDQAESLYLTVLDEMLNRIDRHFPIMSENEKRQFWSTMRSKFEQFNSFGVVAGNDGRGTKLIGRMYNNQLATKALLLNAAIKMKESIKNSENASLISLYEEWIEKREFLTRVYTMSGAQRREEGVEIEQIQEQINDLEKLLSQKSDLFAKTTAVQRYRWQDVREQLRPNEAAIEIIRFRWYNRQHTDTIFYAALVVRPETIEQPEMVLLKNGIELETIAYENYIKSLYSSNKDTTSYGLYWKQISDKLNGVNKIFLSADGVYNLLNANTLYNAKTDSYLFDELEIQLVTNTTDVIQLNERENSSDQNWTAVLFGNPAFNINEEYMEEAEENNDFSLAFRGIEIFDPDMSIDKIIPLANTEKEINSINRLFGNKDWSTDVHVRQDALEENVKNVSNPSVLHIATHGYFQPQNDEVVNGPKKVAKSYESTMLRSGLILAGVTNYYDATQKPAADDGILTAYESTTLNLEQTELVVLSACKTGLGEVSVGEGVYGLQRGLKVAGAKSILMSLWKVNDLTTRELMTSFYDNWLDHGDKFKAFRDAQLELREKYPKPIHWGGFVMVGDNTLLPESEPAEMILWWSVSIAIILIIAIFLVFKRRRSYII